MEEIKNGMIILASLIFILRQVFPNLFAFNKHSISDYNFERKVIGGELNASLHTAECDIAYLLTFKNGEKWRGGLPVEKIRVFDFKVSHHEIEFQEQLQDHEAKFFEDILDQTDLKDEYALRLSDFEQSKKENKPIPFYNSYKGLERRNAKLGLYFAIRDKRGEMIGILCLEYVYKGIWSIDDYPLKHYGRMLKKSIDNISFVLQNKTNNLPKHLQELRGKSRDSVEYLSIFFKNFMN